MRNGKAYREGLWAVSQYNFNSSVNAGTHLPEKVQLLDLTLREGRQVEGVSLSVDEVVEYARRADAAGIAILELHHDEPEEIRQIKKAGLKVKVQSLVHPTASLHPKICAQEIDAALGNGADIICLSIVGSDYNFGLVESMAGLKLTKDEYLDRACEAVAYGKSRGATINPIVTDFSRMDLEWLKTICSRLKEAGADSIRLDDICAPCKPAVYQHHTWAVKQVLGNTPIAMHSHNDFDLGLAGQLAALEGGAEILEGSINGMGERCGVPNLAVLASVLEMFYGYDTGIKLDAMQELSQFVADVWGQPIPQHMPAVGRTAFSHSVEVHYVLPKDGQWAFNAWSPKVVGNEDFVPLCHYSGAEAVKKKARELGVGELETAQAKEVLATIRRELRLRKTRLSDELFCSFVKEVLGKQ